MKRNLLSIVILVLVLVNTVLTVVMMVSVVGTAKKTAALVDGISTALSLEVESQANTGTAAAVPMTDIEVYSLSDTMTIPLADGGDGATHYCLIAVSFSINNKAEGYETYGSDLTAQDSLLRDVVYSVVSGYTMESAKNHQDDIKRDILERVQEMYASEFIFNVSFGQFLFQ